MCTYVAPPSNKAWLYTLDVYVTAVPGCCCSVHLCSSDLDLQDVFDVPASSRSESDIAALESLLHDIPLYSGLCKSAVAVAARYLQLIVLSDSVELPRCV